MPTNEVADDATERLLIQRVLQPLESIFIHRQSILSFAFPIDSTTTEDLIETGTLTLSPLGYTVSFIHLQIFLPSDLGRNNGFSFNQKRQFPSCFQ